MNTTDPKPPHPTELAGPDETTGATDPAAIASSQLDRIQGSSLTQKVLASAVGNLELMRQEIRRQADLVRELQAQNSEQRQRVLELISRAVLDPGTKRFDIEKLCRRFTDAFPLPGDQTLRVEQMMDTVDWGRDIFRRFAPGALVISAEKRRNRFGDDKGIFRYGWLPDDMKDAGVFLDIDRGYMSVELKDGNTTGATYLLPPKQTTNYDRVLLVMSEEELAENIAGAVQSPPADLC
jgi:hypothetical protein